MSFDDIRFRRLAVFGLAAGALLVSTVTVGTQSGNVKATVQIEAAGQPAMTMDYWLSDERVRIDIAQPQAASIVWTAGAAPSMLMIQHGERRYIEWGDQEFQMMRQMMQRMPGGGGGDSSAVNLDDVRFEPTGQTETIGPWSATGVRITGMAPGQEGTVWVASDLDSGLFELFAGMGDALEAIQMPMLGGGGGWPAAAADALPADAGRRRSARRRGRAAERDRRERPTTITLQSFEQGPFADDPFAPPAGYERMQLPTIPG